MSFRKIALHVEEDNGRVLRINLGAVRMENDELSPSVLINIAQQILKSVERKLDA